MFRKDGRFHVRSAGTSDKARRRVTEADLSWADVIFVMDSKHRQLLQRKYGEALADKRVVVLDIPDDYEFMQPELVELFKDLAANFVFE